MPILTTDEFFSLKSENKALLGIDHGASRIGVAKSDAGWFLSNPYGIIQNTKFTKVAEQLEDLIKQNEVCGLVIGLPVTMDGKDNKKCQSIKQFARNLDKLLNIPIIFHDERFTTIQASETLTHYDVSWDKKQAKIDKIAASHILQSFLDLVNRYSR